ncbi:hypothetical protein LWI28_013821 [Acer negundo]|uniref:Uncharacterized protein n=1 Tax=Acer negundo TaxID=4023 RepID=A0AAD5NQ70_ACENE|nr:hypothetical protein LWI28_013821 [Acer negundo]
MSRHGGGATKCSDNGEGGDTEPAERREANLMCNDNEAVEKEREKLEVERRFGDSARRWRWWRMRIRSDDGDAKPASLGDWSKRRRRSWRVWWW